MRVLPDAVIINISPSQKRLLCDPNHARYIQAMILDAHKRRSRIRLTEIGNLIRGLRELQDVVLENPEYSKRRPLKVLEQVILKIKEAQAVQQKAYPKVIASK